MSQKNFQIFRSQISDLKTDNVDYLKKPPWKKFFFDIFAIHLTSRYEKRCQMLQRLFSLFQGSKNQLWDPTYQNATINFSICCTTKIHEAGSKHLLRLVATVNILSLARFKSTMNQSTKSQNAIRIHFSLKKQSLQKILLICSLLIWHCNIILSRCGFLCRHD